LQACLANHTKHLLALTKSLSDGLHSCSNRKHLLNPEGLRPKRAVYVSVNFVQHQALDTSTFDDLLQTFALELQAGGLIAPGTSLFSSQYLRDLSILGLFERILSLF